MQRRSTDANLTEREPGRWPWECWLWGGTRYGQTAGGDADRREVRGQRARRRQVAREESPAAFGVHACGTAGERNATFKTATKIGFLLRGVGHGPEVVHTWGRLD
ncbi:hypothetical protein B0H13DRAFT_1852931 [Mycena leptocephala]|nr:hypothetical protein B0H13DRAFT_1852931 [Mycena leptocephala]